jgi:GNAT superfamily N-acetyltransferase
MSDNIQPKVTFRPMEIEDTKSVLALGMSSLTYVDVAVADPDQSSPYRYLTSGLDYGDLAATDPESPESMSFVAEVDDKIVGFILAYSHFVGIPVTKICIIHAIVVDPDHHGLGIGAELMHRIRLKCKEDNVKLIRMLVPNHDAELKHYLGLLGFRPSNVINFDLLNANQI